MEFSEKFKTYSNADLLRIIENPDDYQPQAIETAKNIFADRQLSETEIKIAKDELDVEKQGKLIKEQQKQAVEDKVKNRGKSVFNHINPIQEKKLTSEKTIRIISILLGGLFLFQLYKQFGMLRFMFTDSYAEWDFSMALYFLPLIMILTATILFYRRKKAGWLLLTIFLVYSAISAIGSFILAIKWKPSGTALENLFPQTPPISYLLSFLFMSGIIWVISREKIRNVYSISKPTMIFTISIVTGILVVAFGVLSVLTNL